MACVTYLTKVFEKLTNFRLKTVEILRFSKCSLTTFLIIDKKFGNVDIAI